MKQNNNREFELSSVTRTITTNGRICLIGEHCDWVSSLFADKYIEIPTTYALTSSINLGITAEVTYAFMNRTSKKSDKIDRIIVIDENDNCLIDINTMQQLDNIIKQKDPDNVYIASSIKMVLLRNTDRWHRNIDTTIRIIQNTLPRNKGLSSSAAICSLICSSLIEGFDYDTSPNNKEKVKLARLCAKEAENAIGSNCGTLDHLCLFEPEGFKVYSFEYNGENRISPTVNHDPLNFILVTNNREKRTPDILNNLQRYMSINLRADQKTRDQNFIDFFIKHSRSILFKLVNAMELKDLQSIGATLTKYQFEYYYTLSAANEICKYHNYKDINDEILDLSIATDFIFDSYFLRNSFEKNKEDFRIEMGDNLYGFKGVGSHGDNSYLLLPKPGCEDKIKELIEKYEIGECTSLTVNHNIKN